MSFSAIAWSYAFRAGTLTIGSNRRHRGSSHT